MNSSSQPSDSSAVASEDNELLSSSATLTLPDGRKLGYAQYGSQTGRPVLCFHGLPGACVEYRRLDTKATDLGLRLVAVDRPGYGWSSPDPVRTSIVDHAKDVQRLADFLELDSCGVMGISGGGPYALACAASMPASRLKGVSIICGLGTPDMSKKGMNWMNWLGLAFAYRYCGWIVRQWWARDPSARLDLSDDERLNLVQQQFSKSTPHPKDAEALNDGTEFKRWLQTARQTFAQGCDGVAQDGRLLTSDWGFRIQDIRRDLPVQLWYGKLDTNVPPVHGEQIAARLGVDNTRLTMKDETHVTITTNWVEQALCDLAQILRESVTSS